MAGKLTGLRQKKKLPPRICLAGDHGLGKTTTASKAPNPIFILTEDGLMDQTVDAFELCKSYDEFANDLAQIIQSDHEYKTLVIDSIDWLENLIHKKVCTDNEVKHIEEIPYAKGYSEAVKHWIDVLAGLDMVREKGMTVILISHVHIRKIEDPMYEAYDIYQLKLHKKATALVAEWVDVLGFITQDTHITKEDKGFGNTRGRAVSTGERILCVTGTPQYQAKNRYGLPDQLPLDINNLLNLIAKGK